MIFRKTILHALAAGKIEPTREVLRIIQQFPEDRDSAKPIVLSQQRGTMARHILMRAIRLSGKE